MTVILLITTLVQSVIGVVLAAVGVAAAALRWILSLTSLLPIIFLLGMLAGIGYVAAGNNDVIIERFLGAQSFLGEVYEATFGPVLNFLRQFYNYLICWWNMLVTYPAELLREVIVPITRDCGILTTIQRFFIFLQALATEVARFFFTTQWQSGELNFDDACAAWIAFWQAWQGVLCCGCNDLCPFFTTQPFFVPPIFVNPLGVLGSSQLSDPDYWCAITNTINGGTSFVQDVLLIIRSKIAPSLYGTYRPTFKRSFDKWVNATSCLMRSTEHAVQLFWDNYIPYSFNFDQILCVFDKGVSVWFKSISIVLKMLMNYDLAIFQFYSNDFFRVEIRRDFIEVLNLFAAPSAFANVTIAVPSYVNISLPTPPVFLNNITVSHYYLNPAEQGTMEGLPNPLYGQVRFTDCFGQFLQRVFCDPQFNGTTCAQRWNGTILEYFSFDCPSQSFWSIVADGAAFFFETLLHGKSANEFIIYANVQPFSLVMKDNAIALIRCFSVFFYVVRDYGFAIGISVTESFQFLIGSFELYFRVVIGLATIPYYEAYLPGIYNIVSDPQQTGLSEALGFYDLLITGVAVPFPGAKRDNSMTLVNAMCSIFNQAFHFPYAGCSTNCTPGFFVPIPPPVAKRQPDGSYESFIEAIIPPQSGRRFISRISPIQTRSDGGNVAFSPLLVYDRMHAPGATAALTFAYAGIDAKLEQFVSSIRTLPACTRKFAYGEHKTCPSRHAVWNTWPGDRVNKAEMSAYSPKALLPVNASLNIPNPVGAALCDTCFDLCCGPRTIVIFLSHLSSFVARLLSNFVISRGGLGSPYFNGKGCNITTGEGTCLAKDLTILTADIMAPLGCVCNFFKLLLPSSMLPYDPCCAFMLLGELMGVLAQIVINVGQSIIGDYDGANSGVEKYAYIKAASGNPGLLADLDIALQLSRETFDCLCNFVTAIFDTILTAVGSDPDLIAAANPCCVPQKFYLAGVEAIRLIGQLVVAFSDLKGKGACYLYNQPQCYAGTYAPSFRLLPIYIQFKRMLDQLFTQKVAIPPRGVCSVKISPNATMQQYEGLQTCTCNTINALMAASFKVVSTIFITPVANGTFGTVDNSMANNCFLDLCAPLYNSGQVIEQAILVGVEVVLAAVQKWEQRCVNYTNPDGPGYIPLLCAYMPVQLMDAFFCDEYGAIGVLTNFNPITNPQDVFPNERFLPPCIQVEPLLVAGFDFLSESFCTPARNGVADTLDKFLEWFTSWISFDVNSPNLFPLAAIWPKCLCQGGPEGHETGIVPPLGNLIVTAVRQAVVLVRNLQNPVFWAPSGGTFSLPAGFVVGALTSAAATALGPVGAIGLGIATGNVANSVTKPTIISDNVSNFRKSWIARGLGPIADAFCDTVTAAGCVLSMILGNTCKEPRYTLISSVFRYVFEAIFRIIALIEAFAQLVIGQMPGQCVSLQADMAVVQDCDKGPSIPGQPEAGGGAFKGGGGTRAITKPLGNMIVALSTFIVDAVLGLGRLGCTSMCNGGFEATNAIRFKPSRNPCDCYNLSPYLFTKSIVSCDAAAPMTCTTPPVCFWGFKRNATMEAEARASRYTCPQGCFCPCNVLSLPPGTCTIPLGFNNVPIVSSSQDKAKYCNWINNYEPLYRDWAVRWNRTGSGNEGNYAWRAFSNYNWERCNLRVTNLTDSSELPAVRAPFVEGGSEPVGWAPNPQGLFGTGSSASATIGNMCPFLPTDGYLSFQQLEQVRIARGYGYNLNAPDYDMLQYCTPGGQSYYGGAHPNATRAPSDYAYWPSLTNTPGCSLPVTGGITGNTVSSYGFPASGALAYNGTTTPSLGVTYTSTPTIVQWARKAFNNYIISPRAIASIPCTGNPDSVCPSCPASSSECPACPLPGLGSLATPVESGPVQWAAMTMNYLRANNRVFYVNTTNELPNPTPEKPNATTPNRLAGIWFTNETFYTGVSALLRFWGFRRDPAAPVDAFGGGGFANHHPLTGDNSFVYARFFNNPYIMLPLCRRDVDSPPSTNYGFGDLGKVTLAGSATPETVQNPDGSFSTLSKYPFSPNTGFTQFQLFEQSSISCVASQICKNDQNVPCSPKMPIVLDGIGRVALLYVRCLVVRFIPSLSFVFKLVLGLLSWVWQLSNGILRFAVAVLMLVLDVVFLFAGGGSFCENACNIFQSIADVFIAFFAIFSQKVIITDARKRADQTVDSASVLQHMGAVTMAYFQPAVDTAACIDNPIPCFCRLVDMPNSCALVNGQVSPQELTTADVTMYLGDHFNGSSVCDYLIQNSTAIEWLDLTPGQRYIYVDCVSKRVLGERLHATMPFVPVDSFYTLDALPRMYAYGAASVTSFAERVFVQPAPMPRAKAQTRAANDDKRHPMNRWYRMIREEPTKYRKVLARHRALSERILETDRIVKPSAFLFHSVSDASVMWMKYHTGFYHHLAAGVAQEIQTRGLFNVVYGDINITESWEEVKYAARHAWQSAQMSTEDAATIGQAASAAYDSIGATARSVFITRDFVRGFTALPEPPAIYHAVKGHVARLQQWWYSEASARAPTTEPVVEPGPSAWKRAAAHLESVTSTWRYNLPDVTAIGAVMPAFDFTPAWSSQQLRTHEAARRIGYRIMETFWPNHLGRAEHQRFILDGDCRLYDGAVNLAAKNFDYCLNQFNVSVPPIASRGLSDYLERTSQHRTGGFFNRYSASQYVWELRNNDSHGRWGLRMLPSREGDPHAAYRAVDARVYKRALRVQGSSPAGFDFFRWFLMFAESVSGYELSDTLDEWTQAAVDWLKNDNTAESDYLNGDVGARYWIGAQVACKFPENLNCASGVGLEQALVDVGKWFIIVILILGVAFPAGLGLIGGMGLLALYGVIVGWYGWHYSPWCLTSFALPECLADEFVNLADNLLGPCPSWLSWFAPLVNGPLCGTAVTSAISCRSIGVSDGISNWLYLAYHYGSPTIFKIVTGLAQAPLFYPILGDNNYFNKTLVLFTDPSPTLQDQLERCFWLTSPSLAGPLLAVIVLGTLVLSLVPAVIAVALSLWTLVQAVPFYSALTAVRDGWLEIPGETGAGPAAEEDEEQEEEEPPAAAAVAPPLVQALGRRMRAVFGYQKQKHE